MQCGSVSIIFTYFISNRNVEGKVSSFYCPNGMVIFKDLPSAVMIQNQSEKSLVYYSTLLHTRNTYIHIALRSLGGK